MNPPQMPESLSITRHCIQQLLHTAMNMKNNSASSPYQGLLCGMHHTFDNILAIQTDPQTDEANKSILDSIQQQTQLEHALIAYFITLPDHETSYPEHQTALYDWLSTQQCTCPKLCVVLEMTHKGRHEIHCYNEDKPQQEIPLIMLEDGTLYQQPLSH